MQISKVEVPKASTYIIKMESILEDEKRRKTNKPIVNIEKAGDILRLFIGNITPDAVFKDLESYDDRNFLVKLRTPCSLMSSESSTLDYILKSSTLDYVLKIHNGSDSRPAQLSFLEAQNAVLQYLFKCGIIAPVPIMSASKNYLEVFH